MTGPCREERCRTPKRCCSSTTARPDLEFHAVLDQCLGADEHVGLARSAALSAAFFCRVAHTAGDQADAGGGQAETFEPRGEPVRRSAVRCQVLFGQDLGGRHERALTAGTAAARSTTAATAVLPEPTSP